jgi:hypothetical protein
MVLRCGETLPTKQAADLLNYLAAFDHHDQRAKELAGPYLELLNAVDGLASAFATTDVFRTDPVVRKWLIDLCIRGRAHLPKSEQRKAGASLQACLAATMPTPSSGV